MSSIQTIRIVSKFEMKTLLRSWFFRIFAGLYIVGLGIFNVAVFVESSGAPWLYRALPAAIPYANLIILNLGQAIVAVFLASEFLKQDRKNDTVEVIYARSMTNGQYILGKTLGILSVFIILNLILLIMGIGFSFLSADSSKGIGEFFLYPLLISIPTLVFILGLSFFLMTVLKNQAITFIILLGYIAVTIFYLNDKLYHLFDYIAYKVPMMNSMIGGFGNLTEVVVHRAIYFSFGIGLIFITVFKLNRLPQTKTKGALPLLMSVIFILLGVYLGFEYVNLKKGVLKQKEEFIAINNQYSGEPTVYVETCQIKLEHLESEIKVNCLLNVTNDNNRTLSTILFSLNPGLKISEVTIDSKPFQFEREKHLIKINYKQGLRPNQKLKIKINYKGQVNENICFLDQKPEQYEDNFALDIFKVRKRFAYLQSDFVCLTSESLWYPKAGVTYAPNKPAYYKEDFTRFELTVQTSPELVAVSQGNVTNQEDGLYTFINDYPLPKISLAIAEYDNYSITVDSVEYSIYSKKGNDFYMKHFTEFKDTMPAIIRELRDEYETLLNLKYGFNRFSFVEIPIHFALDKHIWSVTSDVVQPEMILYPEKGVIMEETDFVKRKNRFEERMKENNEEVSPEELQCRIFKRFIRGNLMAPPTEWYQFENVVDKYTYSLIPHYFSHITQIESENYPILNLALEVYLRERNVNNVSSSRWFWRGISDGEKINLELMKSSLEELIKTGIEKDESLDDDDEQLTLNDLILAKGDYLFSLFRARYGDENFNEIINQLIASNYHQSFSFNELENKLSQTFNDPIGGEIEDWYATTDMPGFLIKDLETYKVLDGEYTKYQVRYKIANPEEIDGIITMTIDLDDKSNTRSFSDDSPEQPDYSRKIFVPAKSALEIGVLFPTEPTRMNIFTNISENLPNNLIYEFSGFDDLKKVPVFDGFKSYPLFTDLANHNEFIVDNEDPNFKVTQESNESYLKVLINKNKKDRYKYSGLHFWNPPPVWKPVLRSGFYGKYIRSAMYTRSGENERFTEWVPELDEAGYYDLYCHIAKINIEWNRDKRKPSYNFRIHNDDGIEEITMTDEELDAGWNYMGTFYISPENAKVEQTNKSVSKMIFSDAIKWVKND